MLVPGGLAETIVFVVPFIVLIVGAAVSLVLAARGVYAVRIWIGEPEEPDTEHMLDLQEVSSMQLMIILVVAGMLLAVIGYTYDTYSLWPKVKP